MNLYTIIGGKGFIGSAFVKHLVGLGHEVWVPEKNDPNIYTKDLGIVIYAAGYGDCTNGYHNVLDANTILLSNILKLSKFSKLVYISSTRVYMNNSSSVENNNLIITADDNRKLFNLTKLVSEELCLKSSKDCLIIRPSNVYGAAINSPLFLPSITRNAVNDGKIDMFVPPYYEKDYVYVGDVVSCTLKLIAAKCKPNSIINIASGMNTTAAELAEVLMKHTHCKVIWHDNVPNETFPKNNISCLLRYIDFEPRNVLFDLKLMIESFKKNK